MGVEMFCKYKLHIGFQRLRMQGKKKKKKDCIHSQKFYINYIYFNYIKFCKYWVNSSTKVKFTALSL